ncbi:MAG: hypothetical protein WCR42_10075 [bacterium]
MKTFFKIFAITISFVALITACETVSPQTGFNCKLISNSECKNGLTMVVESETSDTLSCVEYEYETSTKTLHLNHINAGFNCCPVHILLSAKLSNDTLIVRETERSSLCNCNCLFDLEIDISSVEAGKYYLTFDEPYIGTQEKLFVRLDLSKEKEGSFCVTRKRSPWGISLIN